MSELHLQRIKQKILKSFAGRIDVSDLDSYGEEEKERALLSRGQAVFALSHYTEIEEDKVINSITDTFEDNGIDLLLIDEIKGEIYISQSKWISNGNASPSKKELLTFFHGITDLTAFEFSNFNKKIKARKEEIIAALSDTRFKIKLVFVYTGIQKIAPKNWTLIDEQVEKLNDTYDTFTFVPINQKTLYQFLIRGATGNSIHLEEFQLLNWGKHEEPYEAIYGEIEASILANLWLEHGSNLFDKNLRNFKGDTSVNHGIKNTLSKSPDDFWYFNNGVTVLCHQIEKAAAHSSERKVGKFTFKDISVINGAQTIASLGEAFKSFPDQVGKANVQIRFINVEHAPEGYDTLITRFNNTQNKIENRDFAALDPQQQRLKNEFALDDIQYVFKTGDKRNLDIESCDIEEVTVALACSNASINLSTDAKREIGKFWRDINKPPYTILFNERTYVRTIWNLITILRTIEEELKIYQSGDDTRKIMTSIHGNYFVYHFVIKMIGKMNWVSKNYKLNPSELKTITSKVFTCLIQILKELYPKDFLYTLFKNHKKCQDLSYRMDMKLGLEQNLFTKQNE